MQDEIQAEKSKLEDSKRQSEAEVTRLAADRDGLQQQLTESNEKLANQERALEGIQADLQSEREAIFAFKAQAQEKSQRLAHLESEMDALREVAGIAAGGGKEGDMVSALLSRVAALESAAMEAHKERRNLHNALVDLRGNIR
eukprot:scaffold534530_cov42-Prasinocladus_malaysianus.AAC.1